MSTPLHKNPCPRVMEFTVLVLDLFLVITTITLSDLFLGVEKKVFL